MQLSQIEQKRPYECVIIMHPDASDEQQKTLFRKNKEIIESFKGSVNHVDTWGKRYLANPIGKNVKGIYFHTTFESAPDGIAELERTMGINDKVLRFQHVRLDSKMSPAQHLDKFRDNLKATADKEREREARREKRRDPKPS